jgi:hypothetical protein
MFTPGDAVELLARVDKLVSQPSEAIVDAGMRLSEHSLRQINREEIEGKLVGLLKSITG